MAFVAVVLAALALVVAFAVALVVLTFVRARALVHGRRRGASAAGLAVILAVIAAGLALLFGGARAYSDTACLRHAPAWFGEGSAWTQGTGVWPPGLRCRYEWRGRIGTYADGFEALWVAVAFSVLFGASMGVLVASVPYARRRLGLAPTSSDVGPSAR